MVNCPFLNKLSRQRKTKEIMKTKETQKNTPPKSKGHWLFRDLRELTKSPLKYAIKYQAKYGDLFEVDSLSHKVMFASHPDIAKHLLVDNNKAYFKSFDYEILKLVLGICLYAFESE